MLYDEVHGDVFADIIIEFYLVVSYI